MNLNEIGNVISNIQEGLFDVKNISETGPAKCSGDVFYVTNMDKTGLLIVPAMTFT